MNCTKCGHEIETGSAFCGNCGHPVQAVAPTREPSIAGGPPQSIEPTSSPVQVAPATTANVPNAPVGQSLSDPSPQHGPAYSIPSETRKAGGGKAIASLILGLIGLVAWLIPILGIIFGILAIVFGTLSVRSWHRKLAITGIVLSVITMVLSLFALTYNMQQLDPQDTTTTMSIAAALLHGLPAGS